LPQHQHSGVKTHSAFSALIFHKPGDLYKTGYLSHPRRRVPSATQRFAYLIPIQKSKLTRRRAADSTDSKARRDNEVRLFFGLVSHISENNQLSIKSNYLIVSFLMAATCLTTQAVLQAGLLPAQERRKGSFAKVSPGLHPVCVFSIQQKGRLKE
jgi:hypothetical protein